MYASRNHAGWVVAVLVGACAVVATAAEPALPGGELRIIEPGGGAGGACPLKHTAVEADIAGFVGRVTIRQIFHNPTERKIEAVYVFPLPQDAAVDDMVMTVGERRIVGQIKEREEARDIYEAAKAAGHVASLLDQERPNIFTQSVANIEPGVEVVIEISYVETLKYEDGVFEWVFPMVVGPRYIPGGGSAAAPMTRGRPTPEVPDADRITPPVTPKGTRAGHDISLSVQLDAGMGLYDLESVLHEVDVQTPDRTRAIVTLKNETEIPNKDFILRYRLATDEIGDALLVHSDERGAFFTLILQPPQRVVPEQVVPRELIFVLDTSGSMSGFPIEKAKRVMALAIGQMLPDDTFNLITFAGDTRILWDEPRPATEKNVAEAQAFLDGRRGSGGTEMMKAINAALVQTRPETSENGVEPIRVVCFMTDGYVGNDMAIIDAVKQNAGTTRVFSFGVGNSVNRFLLDGMAHAGRGAVEYVSLSDDGDAAAARFHERILAPVLTDIAVDWGDLPVVDLYPRRIPDLFSAKPIMIHGRLTGPANGEIVLKGNTGAGPYEARILVQTPPDAADHEALASLWARAKVSDLMMQDYAAAQQGAYPEALKRQVIDLGLEYRLMTQFTSFVAVEEMTVTVGGEPVKVDVPVEMPDGVSYEGVFAEGGLSYCLTAGAPQRAYGFAGGRGGGKKMRRSKMAGMAGRPAPAPTVVGGAPMDAMREELDVEKADPAAVARAKLAEPLRDLSAKVVRDGDDGNLTVGKMRVVDYRVDVMIFLRDASVAARAALEQLGFKQTTESRSVSLLIGSIDVRKLEALSKLDAIIRVKPVVVP